MVTTVRAAGGTRSVASVCMVTPVRDPPKQHGAQQLRQCNGAAVAIAQQIAGETGYT